MDKTSSREELPGLVCALSRCYRAETGRIGEPASKILLYIQTKIDH